MHLTVSIVSFRSSVGCKCCEIRAATCFATLSTFSLRFLFPHREQLAFVISLEHARTLLRLVSIRHFIMSPHRALCALVALAFASIAYAQTKGTLYIVEAGVEGAVEAIQEDGTTVFCPTKYDGGFNIECTYPGNFQRVLFKVGDKIIHDERNFPYFLAGNNGKNVLPWKNWKRYVDTNNVLALTCMGPDRVEHTAKIKFDCPLPPKSDCVVITPEDALKDSIGMTSGMWKMKGKALEYTGIVPKKMPAPAELSDGKFAVSFPFIGAVTKQNLCVVDVTTTTPASEVAFFLKSDSGFAFSTNAAPIDDMLTRSWSPVYYDKVNMGQTKVGTKMYPLITASMREGMEIRFSIAGKANGLLFHKIICVECDGDICTPDKTYIKKALARCGM